MINSTLPRTYSLKASGVVHYSVCDLHDCSDVRTPVGAGQGRYCFNYSLPNCVISGSASARIAVTGTYMHVEVWIAVKTCLHNYKVFDATLVHTPTPHTHTHTTHTHPTGDLMSPPDLDRLLVLPSGCGEQNLVRTAVNWVVAGYLQSTGQLQDFLEVKIRNNIMTGVQSAKIFCLFALFILFALFS